MEPVKVVVAGPAGAGKSTLVRAIADLTVRSSDPNGTVFDLGRITIGRDLVLYLYGAPAEPDRDGGWSGLAAGMVGSIVVVDCLRPDGPVHAIPHVRWFKAQGVPLLVAANRCPSEATAVLAQQMGLPAGVVVALDAADREQVKGLVVTILETALSAAQPTAVSLEMRARLG
jgi:signal recognition particle receptor subunit beta